VLTKVDIYVANEHEPLIF